MMENMLLSLFQSFCGQPDGPIKHAHEMRGDFASLVGQLLASTTTPVLALWHSTCTFLRLILDQRPVWQQWGTDRGTWKHRRPPSWEQSRTSPPGSPQTIPNHNFITAPPVDRYSILLLEWISSKKFQASVLQREIAVHQKVLPSKIVFNLIFLNCCRSSIGHQFGEPQNSHDNC